MKTGVARVEPHLKEMTVVGKVDIHPNEKRVADTKVDIRLKKIQKIGIKAVARLRRKEKGDTGAETQAKKKDVTGVRTDIPPVDTDITEKDHATNEIVLKTRYFELNSLHSFLCSNSNPIHNWIRVSNVSFQILCISGLPVVSRPVSQSNQILLRQVFFVHEVRDFFMCFRPKDRISEFDFRYRHRLCIFITDRLLRMPANNSRPIIRNRNPVDRRSKS